MSRKAAMPYDVKQECLWIVRGYDRRVRAYHEARRDVIDGTPCGFCDTKEIKGENGKTIRQSIRVYTPHGNGEGRPDEDKLSRLEAIEQWPETKKMKAVEYAKLHIGLDINNEELRQRLTESVMLNCRDRHEYPFRCLKLPDISERDFYRRKENFIHDVAEYLGMI